ncbi:MAG TPA: zf-TFIIB domain-containing protein [Gemmatimonadaceae bacterium]|nr:zf-TFIIB domain-containing protein [Gemmatimonadaceae bacterium]
MDASTLNCPDCGAAVPASSRECSYCHARLATIGCPKCYALVFIGSKHCPRCGTDITQPEDRDAPPLSCPRKCGPMRPVRFGGADMYTCAACNGLWVDPETLQRLVSERLKPSPLVATGIPAPPPTRVQLDTVHYAPCPVCKNLMNRVNFAHASGVIVDVCTNHGTWFDADELRRVLEFISAGGLEAARARELRQTPATTPMPSVEDPWRVMRPILEGDDGKVIIKALISFTGRKKV